MTRFRRRPSAQLVNTATLSKPVTFERESGFTAVEVLIATLLLTIVVSMTFGAVTVIDGTTVRAVNGAAASEHVQLALSTIEGYLSGAITPNAVTGADASATSSCWGTTSPGVATATVSSPQTTAFLTADDYEALFCGVPPNGSAGSPHVYHLWLNQSTCTYKATTSSHPPSLSGYCTLQLDDWGPGSPGSTPTPKTVATVTGVWCDATCQTGVSGYSTYPSDTPPIFAYYNSNQAAITTPTTPIDFTNDTGIDWTAEASNAGTTAHNYAVANPTSLGVTGSIVNTGSIVLNLTVLASSNKFIVNGSKSSGDTVVTQIQLPSA